MNAHRRGLAAFALTFGALLMSVLLIVWALVYPAYTAVSTAGAAGSASTVTTTVTHSTLIDENGAGVLIPVSMPLFLCAIAWLGMHAKCSRGSHRGRTLAVAAFALLFGFAIISGFSIGLLVIPIALLLGTALALTPGGSHPAG
jgi:hypothetical protein